MQGRLRLDIQFQQNLGSPNYKLSFCMCHVGKTHQFCTLSSCFVMLFCHPPRLQPQQTNEILLFEYGLLHQNSVAMTAMRAKIYCHKMCEKYTRIPLTRLFHWATYNFLWRILFPRTEFHLAFTDSGLAETSCQASLNSFLNQSPLAIQMSRNWRFCTTRSGYDSDSFVLVPGLDSKIQTE